MPFKTCVPHHIAISRFTGTVNEFTSFYGMSTLGLIRLKEIIYLQINVKNMSKFIDGVYIINLFQKQSFVDVLLNRCS